MIKNLCVLFIFVVVLLGAGICEGIEVKYSRFENQIVNKVLETEKSVRRNEVEVVIKNYNDISKKLAGCSEVNLKPYKNMKLRGDFAVLVEAVDRKGKIGKHYLWVKVKINKSIFRAKNLIKRKAVISESDLTQEKRDIAELPGNVVLDRKEIVGKEAKFNIIPGRIFLSWMIRDIPLVRNRDEVTIVAKSNDFEVTVQGIAMEDGALGEEIEVKNLSSEKKFIAKVIGEKKVAVSVVE